MTPALLDLLRRHVSAEAYRHLPPDDLWARFRDALDETAFRVLLERLGGRVYQRCRAVLGDDHLAEEAFQETFVALTRRRAALPGYRQAAAWAYQAATNHARHLRRTRRRELARAQAAAKPEAAAADAAADARDAAGRALAALPDKFRRPIELVYWDGLTHAEAAAALGWPKGTVDVYVARGLARLRADAGRLGLSVAAAGGLEAALAGPAPALTDAAIAGATRAWAAGTTTAAGASWAAGWAWAAALTAAGTVAVAGVWWTATPQPAAPPAAHDAPAADEPLEARNLRLVRADVLPPLLAALGRGLAADNPLAVTAVRAAGSEVEVEVRPARPDPVALPAFALRVRYCVLRRQTVMTADETDTGVWQPVDPNRPIVLVTPNPLVPFASVTRGAGRDRTEAARRAFDRLPPDDRAEAEQVRALFGTPGGEVLLPTGTRGVSGHAGTLSLVTNDGVLFVRPAGGWWRSAGECPGWFPVVVGDRVYCLASPGVLVRPLTDPTAAWATWAAEPPPKPNEVRTALFVTGGRVWLGRSSWLLYSRPLDAAPADGWTEGACGLPAEGIAEVGGVWYAREHLRLFARPAADRPGGWTPIGPWPSADAVLHVADGDRLLCFGWGAGPVYARPASAAPEAAWAVAGRVHDPFRR